jgi:Tetratricopeptide repeat/RDD family
MWSGTKPRLAAAVHERGRRLMETGHWDQALACFDEALKLVPACAEMHQLRATLLAQLGRHEEAEKDRLRAAALAQESAAADCRSAIGGFQVPPQEPDISLTEARWLGFGAFLIDLIFGYGPAYAGFWLALFELNPDAQEFAVIVDKGSELLAAVVGYLIVARFLLTLWRSWRYMPPGVGLVEDRPRDNRGDRVWFWLLELEGFVIRLIGRPLEAALALGLFVLGWHALESLGPESDPGSILVVFSTWTLALFIGPWVLGFRQVWEGNGQTLGRSLFGIQLQDRAGQPAGFLRLLLRDGVCRPLTCLGAYAAFGLVLMVEVWLVLPLVVLSGGKLSLLLRPFALLWRAVAGGECAVTLHDLLAGTRVRLGRRGSPTRVSHARGWDRA